MFRRNSIKEMDYSSRIIEDTLKTSSQQVQSVDPQTEIQWQRLRNSLASEKSNVDFYSVASKWFSLKPAIAFIVVVLIAFSVVWFKYPYTKIYTTTQGERKTILLQDSTEVILNSLSELIVESRLFETSRRAKLKGEAFFHVSKNNTPFILTTEIGTVEVLGTEFNVRTRNENMEVAVRTGIVKVGNNLSGKDSSVILTKEQIVSVKKNSFPELPSKLPFSDYPGWLSGKFLFYRTSLAEVCEEMELQFGVKIIIPNPNNKSITLTGTIDGKNVENALVSLVELTGNKYRYEEGKYIIY